MEVGTVCLNVGTLKKTGKPPQIFKYNQAKQACFSE